ncbi:MAG: nucleotidyltransferase domain-containing protein [Ardenticatenaceae bacterium]|nr:nucleotidyltransferase domain-containing protein [Ardenticatenaceae bacterium]MCB9446361.1 nucleotidyltransferase domain-containing protein [Ardenticatenaceae bacterium]
MNQLSHVPQPKQEFLQQLVADLRQVPNVTAVVLGGSYASQTHHDTSDLDIGLYYHAAAPFTIAAIRQIANKISVKGNPVVTDFYEWGAWVNGGAWMETAVGKVDFLYRNLEQVERTIADAQQGIVQHDYDQQPTHGFYSVIYLAETRICIPLHDPGGLIARLKRRVADYPPALKAKIILDSLWSAEFTLQFAQNYAAQGDVYNTVGCLTRTAANLTQALFALNETYFMRDKKVMETLAAFPILPADYVERVTAVLAHPGQTALELQQTVMNLKAVWHTTVSLTGGFYKPKFQI